jgi:hypothetical protein
MISNGQHEEACTSQGAAWQGWGQFQGKARGWSSCRSKGTEGLHLRAQSSSWPMAAQDLEESPLACMPLALKLTPCIWFAHCHLIWQPPPAALSQQRPSSNSLLRPPLINDLFLSFFLSGSLGSIWCSYKGLKQGSP